MTELASAEVAELVERPNGVATFVVRGIECIIPLDGVVDIGEEVARLDKQLAKLQKDVSSLEKRLSNKGFTDKAPADVVDGFREKLDTAKLRFDTLAASRARLAEAL
jgi:valyl-tRNA synthetase